MKCAIKLAKYTDRTDVDGYISLFEQGCIRNKTMQDYYTDDDESLIEIQAAREQIDTSLELDGQAVIESLMFHGFNR